MKLRVGKVMTVKKTSCTLKLTEAARFQLC